MTEYYQKKLQEGLEYQDYIFEKLKNIEGMPIFLGAYSSLKNQYKKGESSSGLEIKYDGELEKTRNLYIEIAEKTNHEKNFWTNSGIMRNDNSWLYLIGNYQEAFLFAKNVLRYYCKNYNYYGGFRKVISATKTSQGIIIPTKFIKAVENDNNIYPLCLKHIYFQ